MATAGSELSNQSQPLWLLAELTYRCPLQCPYCSNPVEMAKYKNELSTEDWIRVMQQSRKMGATQLGFFRIFLKIRKNPRSQKLSVIICWKNKS